MKTPVTRESLAQHFTYNWWKYLLCAVLAFGIVDILYAVTAPRTPEEKKVEFYVYGYADQDLLDAYMETVRVTEMPDMVEMSSITMLADDQYGQIQLTTYLAVREGDLYLLPRDEFITAAAAGFFVPLEEDRELMDLFTERGINLQSGWRRMDATGETHLYGIPASKVPGLSAYCYQTSDAYLCILVGSGNEDNTELFLRILCRDMINPPEEVPQETTKEEPAA